MRFWLMFLALVALFPPPVQAQDAVPTERQRLTEDLVIKLEVVRALTLKKLATAYKDDPVDKPRRNGAVITFTPHGSFSKAYHLIWMEVTAFRSGQVVRQPLTVMQTDERTAWLIAQEGDGWTVLKTVVTTDQRVEPDAGKPATIEELKKLQDFFPGDKQPSTITIGPMFWVGTIGPAEKPPNAKVDTASAPAGALIF